MRSANQGEQHDLVRDRFTRTAEIFASSVLKTRAAEAETLARMVSATTTDCAIDRAIDLACGTGALAMAFAPRVGWICGLDLTPAMLAVAQRTVHDSGARNVAFAIGNAQQVPCADRSMDLALSSYALHHVPDAQRMVGELSRVLKPGGRVGVIDIFVPEDRRRAEMHDRIERVRDPSHTHTLARSEFESYFAAKGLNILSTHVEEHIVTFDQWMHTAGRALGDPEYIESRRLMESTISDDLAGFHPRYAASASETAAGEPPTIEMVNSVAFVAAEKI
jgi:ubiquinone/menaquinone biosynthesis C-methylase UbiE